MGKITNFIDMWYGHKFKKKRYKADAYFNELGFHYTGNIYNDDGQIIGDYRAIDSQFIEKNFIIKWRG